ARGHPRRHALAGRREPRGDCEGAGRVLGPGGLMPAPDPGLFGPDSVTWRIHADPVQWVGGLRSLLLQALHPVAMAGVAQHSAVRYVAEQTRLGPLVGLPVEGIPSTARDLTTYFNAIRPGLRATPDAMDAARLIVWPPIPLRIQLVTPARPAWTAIGSLAFALMPRWARRLYRLPGLPTTDLTATAGLRVLAAGLHRLPERYREGPNARSARPSSSAA